MDDLIKRHEWHTYHRRRHRLSMIIGNGFSLHRWKCFGNYRVIYLTMASARHRDNNNIGWIPRVAGH
jgi:hypothetical protein